jgi:hypothetical protein
MAAVEMTIAQKLPSSGATAAFQTFVCAPNSVSIVRLSAPDVPHDLPLSPDEYSSSGGTVVLCTIASNLELGPATNLLISEFNMMSLMGRPEPGVVTKSHLQMPGLAAVGDGMGRLDNTAKLATSIKIAESLNMPLYLVFIVAS